MIQIRKSADRGQADHGWLKTSHSFSFAGYHDPRHMGFRSLRVINEDHVAPGSGFGRHPHRDMEILTWMLAGSLEHEDSMGNGSVIRPGEIQRMSAGTGVEHSEWNHSKDEPVHLLQIWILPERSGLEPGYEQLSVPASERRGRLRRIASPYRTGGTEDTGGAVRIHADASLYDGLLDTGQEVVHELRPGRHAWVQVARGRIRLGDHVLEQGDGAAVSDEDRVALEALAPSEVLLFDLA